MKNLDAEIFMQVNNLYLHNENKFMIKSLFIQYIQHQNILCGGRVVSVIEWALRMLQDFHKQ